MKLTVSVDSGCGVIAQLSEEASGVEVKTVLKPEGLTITGDLVERLLVEAREHKYEDDAQSAIARAESLVRQAQDKGWESERTRRMEQLIAEIGVGLSEGDRQRVISKSSALEEVITSAHESALDFSSSFAELFGGFGATRPKPKAPPELGKNQAEPRHANLSVLPVTSATVLVQSFLESIDAELERKRTGAWEALNSGRHDCTSQACHSMREVLRLMVTKLAPDAKIVQATWYKKPLTGSPINRTMRIRYALTGDSLETSDSAFKLVEDLSSALQSMYAKLSAESHTDKGMTVSAARMYLAACEGLIGLFAAARYM